MTLDDIARLLRPLASRVANTVSRAVVRGVDDSTKLQELQLELLSGEVRGDLERFQEYGFTSVPDEDAEAVAVFVAGRREHGLVIKVDDRRYRLTGLGKGEVAVYDKTGSKLVLKANGDIEVTPHSGKLKVNGDVEATGDVKAGTVSLKNHTHAAGTLTYINAAGTPTLATGSTGGPT